MIDAVQGDVEARLRVAPVAGEKDLVGIGAGRGGILPRAVVEGWPAIRIVDHPLDDRPVGRVHQGRDVEVRVVRVVQDRIAFVVQVAVGVAVAPAQARRMDVSQAPDVLLVRVGVAARADLQDLV